MLKTAAALIALLAASPALAQALTPAEQARIDAIVARALAADQTPSASIAVVRGGKIVMAKAYGQASPKLAATPDLPYQIASNSKQFTAMAVLLLADEGKLSLDDSVSKFLPGITDGDKITIRELLSHTSGLQDYWPQDYSFADMSRPVTPQGIVDKWAKKPLDYAPGTQWQYSNTGYVVAGMIVEKVAGMTLLDFLKARIFRPLGMTSVVDQDLAIGPRYPVGYGRAALGPLRIEPPAARGWLYAAGELSMTAADLAKWDIARMDRALVPARDWAIQETPVRLTSGKDTGYGLGVTLGDRGGHRVVTHGGEAVGFLSTNTVYPDDRIAVVVLTNSWSGSAYRAIARGIADLLLPPAAAPAGADVAAAAKVRAAYDQLRAGRIDRKLLTPNASYYFTAQRVADFGASLGPLGPEQAIEPAGPSSLRGGFVIQGYTVKYPGRTLNLSTFTEPGPNGRIEQFLVTPGE
ncbi:serine hydrolase domain-containing protein [Sphingomonas sp. ASV193]|uniref:serine hydrolase domain-containing protein n=1 Tax=Sphingomonas sp. ASV193 TaxID=3144405 RepID=UPI0032E8D684